MHSFPAESTLENNAGSENKSKIAPVTGLSETTAVDVAQMTVDKPIAVRSSVKPTPATRATATSRFVPNVTVASDRGPRSTLEDVALGIVTTVIDGSEHGEPRTLLGVFDGVGGEKAGTAAARIASTTVQRVLMPVLTSGRIKHKGACSHAMLDTLQQANELIAAIAASDPDLEGMATTAVVALVCGSRAIIAACGDSSAIHIRQSGALLQTTPDTSEAHVITEYLGKATPLAIQIHFVTLELDDTLVLVSDGVTDVLSPDDIARIVESPGNVSRAKAIVSEALAEFTNDNATAVVYWHTHESHSELEELEEPGELGKFGGGR